MNATVVVQKALDSTNHLASWFLSDLSDADLFVRPVPGANHIAWQFGHLIHSQRQMVASQLPGAALPELPAGFAEKHDNKNTKDDGPAGFATKAVYLELFGKIHQATTAAIQKLSDADLDRPSTGPMAQFAPTLGEFLLLIANHTMMHAGQFSVTRRKLGKPVLF
jgi:hypothetical protein